MVIEEGSLQKKEIKLGNGKSISLYQNFEAEEYSMKNGNRVGTWKYYYEISD